MRGGSPITAVISTLLMRNLPTNMHVIVPLKTLSGESVCMSVCMYVHVVS